MNLSIKTITFFITALLFTTSAFAVDVTIPDFSVPAEKSFVLPINVSDLTGQGVYSFDFTLIYDPAILATQSATQGGTLSSPWGTPTYNITSGQIRVGVGGTQALSGSGTLMKIVFTVKSSAQVGQTSLLVFSAFTFNEGTPQANVSGATFTVIADTEPPVITSGPDAGSITSRSVTISWRTDEPSNSVLEYGETSAYGQTLSNASYVTNHSFQISGLRASTTYHFRVGSTDKIGNGPTYSADAAFTSSDILVSMPNRAIDPGAAFSVPVQVTDLTEQGITSCAFTVGYDGLIIAATGVSIDGSLVSAWDPPVFSVGEGRVEVSMSGAAPLSGAGKLVEIAFLVNSKARVGETSPLNFDSFTFNFGQPPAVTTGGTFTVKDTRPPIITAGPEIVSVTSTGAVLRWQTNERSFGRVEYGTTSAYGQSENLGVRKFAQTATLSGLDPKTEYHFRVGATDSSGNGPTYSEDLIFTTEPGGDILVSIPDQNISVGGSFTIPVQVSDLTGQGVIAVNIVLRYDTKILTPTNVTTSGGLMQNWETPTTHFLDGLIVISSSGSSPLTGSGTLVNLFFDVSPQIHDGATRIEFARFMFNQGWPDITATGATLTITGNPDVSPPQILFGPYADNVGFDSAEIVWFTDEPSDAVVDYGASTSYGLSAQDANFSTEHRIALSGLNQNTTYHFRVFSKDARGNGPTNSTDAAFTTISGAGVSVSIADVSQPSGAAFSVPISVGSLSGLAVYSADIVVTYNPQVLTASEASTSGTLASSWTPVYTITEGRIVIAMGGIQPLSGSGKLVNLRFNVSQSAQIGEFSPIVFSGFIFNEGTPSAITHNAMFTVKDVTEPLIEAGPIVTALSPTSASIIWATDEAGTGSLEYGTSIAYGYNKSSSQLTHGHLMVLSGLASNTTYHFRVASSDASGNGPTRSADFIFITPKKIKIRLTVPDTSVTIGQSFDLPVFITGLYGHSVSSLSFRLSFDANIFTVNGATHAGTIAEAWGIPNVSIGDGYLDLSMSGASVLVGAGTLVKLQSLVPTNAVIGSACDLIISDVLVNNIPGDVELVSGSFIVRDNTPPAIFGPFVESITPTSAEISWDTDEPSNAVVEYGITRNYGQIEKDDRFLTHHTIMLHGLDPSTTYHFRVSAFDQFGNGPTLSPDQEFTTQATTDVRVQLQNAEAGPGQMVEIPLTVNEVTGKNITGFSFTLIYQPTAVDVAEVVTASTLTSGWGPPIVNKTEGRIEISMAGGTALSGAGDLLRLRLHVLPTAIPGSVTSLVLENFIFNSGSPIALTTNGTITILDTVPPLITFGPFAGSVTQNSAEISWQTDEPVTGVLEYGTSESYGQTVQVDSLKTHQVVTLHDLQPATLYHYRVACSDEQGNGPTNSADKTFKTASEDAVLVSLSDQTAGPGSRVEVLISVSEVSGKNITQYSFALLFQAEYLQFQNVETSGTLSENWHQPNVVVDAGRVEVSLSGGSPLQGSGVLLRLWLQVSPTAKPSVETILVLNDFIFNDGAPPATTDNGVITIVDTVPPVITFGPFVGSITQNSAEISWETDEASDSQVEYGISTAYGQTVRNDNLTKHHIVRIHSLAPATTYHFRVASTDALNNGPIHSNDGTFTTTSSQAVLVRLANKSAGPGDEFEVELSVGDLSGRDIKSFSFSILYQSEYIDINGVTTSGTLCAGWGEPVVNKQQGRIEVSHSGSTPLSGSGVLLRITAFIRPNTLLGQKTSLVLSDFMFNDGFPPATVQNSIISIVDTSQPVFSIAPAVSNVKFNSATITWETLRPSRAVVNYGTSTGYGLSIEDTTLSQSHQVQLSGLQPLTTYHFSVTATNASNTASTQSPDQTFTTLSSEIQVVLPDTTISPGASFLLPVLVTQLDGHNITAVSFRVNYDASILTGSGVTVVGSITGEWGAPQFSDPGGQMIVSMTGDTPLSGAGVLVYLGFKVSGIAQTGASCNLSFADFKFNQGQPIPNLQNGTFTVGQGGETGDVTVSLPDTVMLLGTIASLPVFVDDLTGLGVLSYQFTVSFDANVVSAAGVSTAGAIANVWGQPEVTMASNSITVASSGRAALSGGGTFLYLNFQVSDTASEGDSSQLIFSAFRFNRGNPSAKLVHGMVHIAKRYDIIAGHVYDEDTDQPISGAAVRIVRVPSGPTTTTTTDPNGYFQFLDLNQGDTYNLSASKSGYLDSDTLKDVAAGSTNLQLYLQAKKGTIQGWVKDEDAKPVYQALVVVDDEHGNFGSANSDSSGWFVIENLAKKYRYVVRASKFGFANFEIRNVPVDTLLTVVMSRNWGGINGTVTFATGSPAEGVMVLAKIAATYETAGIDTTDAQGQYRIERLASETYNVQPDQPGYISEPGSHEVFVAPGEVITADFTIEEAVLSHIEIHGDDVLIPNNSPSRFNMTAYSTKGPEMSLGSPYWHLYPPTAGSATQGYIYPKSDFIGGALITVTAPQTTIAGSLNVVLYAQLGPENSATLHDSSGLTVEIPSGALPSQKKVRVEVINLPPFKKNTSRYSVIGHGYQLKPDGIELNRPIRLTFPLHTTLNKKSLTAGSWDRANAEWVGIRGATLSLEGDLEAEFSKFTLVAALLYSQPLGLHNLEMLPNPFSPDVDTDMDGFPGLAINFTLTSRDARRPFLTTRVYNMLGDLVRELAVREPYEKDRKVTLRWDGRTDNGLLARNGRYVVHLLVEDARGKVEEVKTVVLIR